MTLMVLMSVLLSIFGCNNASDDTSLRSGDLLFQQCADNNFTEAIVEATGSQSGCNFAHVGIFTVRDGDSLVIEAVPDAGVVLTPLRQFVDQCSAVVAMRIDADVSVMDAVERALTFVGREYDWEFAADNDKIYCSELVQMCYLYADSTPIFESVAMNFMDDEGVMPQFWIDLYQQLGIPIPQDEPGTNPNSIYSSPLLKRVSTIR